MGGAGGSAPTTSSGRRSSRQSARPAGTARCQAPLSLVEALLQPDEEVMGQEHQRHLVVPPAPEAQFVMVEAHFAFPLLEAGPGTLWVRPAQPAHPH